MKEASKRIVVLVVLLSLLISSVPVSQEKTYSVNASSLTTMLANPSGSINTSSGAKVLINEVMFNPSEGNYEWVELKNIGPGSIDISGFSITDEDNNWYEIPDALPPVPEGAFVVVVFDGLGASLDDYEFSDNVAYLHSQAGIESIFENDSDQVSLYSMTHNVFLPLIKTVNSTVKNEGNLENNNLHVLPNRPVFIKSFVAWGDETAGDVFYAIKNGLWYSGWVQYPFDSTGAMSIDHSIETNRSLGLLPDQAEINLENLVFYKNYEVTQGLENPTPSTTMTNIEEGELIPNDSFSIGWTVEHNATYQLQIDDNQDFSSPLIDEVVSENYYSSDTPFPVGVYWWRVQTIIAGNSSLWSTPIQINVYSGNIILSGDENSNLTTNPIVNTVSLTWLRQKKDTNLLCLDGDPEGVSELMIEGSWDDLHPNEQLNPHGYNNCVRASIAMIVRNYGGWLSQDYLSYHLFENYGNPIDNVGKVNEPELDLGHNRTTWVCEPDGNDGRELLAWALNVDESEIEYHDGKPEFLEIAGRIENGQPLMRYWNGHVTAIGGYRVQEDGTREVLLYDSYFASKAEYKNYSTLNFGCYYVAPASAPNVRSDDVEIWMDSDDDGIYDFDEAYRFHTDPNDPDSDGDGVNDKQDIREYVFDNLGNYQYRSPYFGSGDNDRKELDWDNDDGGCSDGYEDSNHNGIHDAGETNNFNSNDDIECPVNPGTLFSDDFSTNPNTNGLWEIYRYNFGDTLNEASWDADNLNLFLTRAEIGKASAIFANFDLTINKWVAIFNYKSGGGSGSDGFVFNFYKDKSAYGVPNGGGLLGFQLYPNWDFVSGYGIEFDNFYNLIPEIRDPSGNHIALIKDSVGNHLCYHNDPRTEDDLWHLANIYFDNGLITVSIDGQVVLNYLIPNPDYTYSGVGFSAATGAYTNNHVIDNFTINIVD